MRCEGILRNTRNFYIEAGNWRRETGKDYVMMMMMLMGVVTTTTMMMTVLVMMYDS